MIALAVGAFALVAVFAWLRSLGGLGGNRNQLGWLLLPIALGVAAAVLLLLDRSATRVGIFATTAGLAVAVNTATMRRFAPEALASEAWREEHMAKSFLIVLPGLALFLAAVGVVS